MAARDGHFAARLLTHRLALYSFPVNTTILFMATKEENSWPEEKKTF
jgi:hypothetical protein